jgi:hypothetical protein
MNTEILIIIGFAIVIAIMLSNRKEPTVVKVEQPERPEEIEEEVEIIEPPSDRFYNTIYDNVFWNEYWPYNDPHYRYVEYHGHPRYYDKLPSYYRSHPAGVSGYEHSKHYHSATPSHKSTTHRYMGNSYRQHTPSTSQHAYKHTSPSYTGVPLRRKHSFEKFTQEDED